MEVIHGVLLHAVGASSASLCYTPQARLRGWSWQTYWLAQAAWCWLLIPVIVAWLTIPELGAVLQEAPAGAMWRSFGLGIAYGIGGTAFGMSIRYLGISLTYAIAVGISCVLGTLLPPFVAGTLSEVLSGTGSSYMIGGVMLGATGILACGWAGRSKERDIAEQQGQATSFSWAKGLPIVLLAGVLSAMYGFSLDQGQPIADVAARHGAGSMQGNVIYLFSNTGAFLSTMLYCVYLHRKEGTFREYGRAVPGLSRNHLLALLTGILWYGQFFFYGLGHVRMGRFAFSSWAVHMILLVMISTLAGLLLKEWKGTRSRTRLLLAVALMILAIAVLMLTYGNRLASEGISA